jgi:hypothetical protein
MKRKGTQNHQFAKRIPADLRERMVGMKLEVPLDGSTVPIKIGPSTQTIRFSLRTSKPEEVKARTAAAIQYLEQLFRSLRADAPVVLTHGQAVALSRDIYDAWSNDPGHQSADTVAVELSEDGNWRRSEPDIKEVGEG